MTSNEQGIGRLHRLSKLLYRQLAPSKPPGHVAAAKFDIQKATDATFMVSDHVVPRNLRITDSSNECWWLKASKIAKILPRILFWGVKQRLVCFISWTFDKKQQFPDCWEISRWSTWDLPVSFWQFSYIHVFFLTSLNSDFRFSPFFHHGTWRQPTLDSAAVDTLTGTTGTTGTLLEP